MLNKCQFKKPWFEDVSSRILRARHYVDRSSKQRPVVNLQSNATMRQNLNVKYVFPPIQDWDPGSSQTASLQTQRVNCEHGEVWVKCNFLKVIYCELRRKTSGFSLMLEPVNSLKDLTRRVSFTSLKCRKNNKKMQRIFSGWTFRQLIPILFSQTSIIREILFVVLRQDLGRLGLRSTGYPYSWRLGPSLMINHGFRVGLGF